ncbi:MAG: LacI family transcriptional regulator [Eubacteriales bacterium]|nr:LacI family transcriptional regulator [Eubacteriales bacterium]
MSTIREVARQANVSIATVSRVLNNDTTYKMTTETRERVWKAITDLNYKAPISHHRRIPPASETAYRKIGCIVNLRGGKYSDPYYLSLLSGLECFLAENRSEISFVRTWNELENSETLIRTFADPLDGLIVMSHLGEATFRYAQSKVRHIVGIDSGYPEIDNIEFDHEQASRLAVDYLAGKGFTDIGFIGGPEGKTEMRKCRRYRAYANALEERGLNPNHDWVIDCEWNDALCSRLVTGLGKDRLPRSFVAASDLMAMAALRALSAMGVSVPEEVAVIGLTNIAMSKYANPPLTTIEIPTEAMGEAAGQILLSRIGGDNSLPRRILFPCHYVVRESA